MNGYDPGGKEWPTSRMPKQMGGSRSSPKESSNLVFFIEPNKVFPAVNLFEVLPIAVYPKAIFLVLFWFPLSS
jgi:hypothetical protein